MFADLPETEAFLDLDYPLPQPKADVAVAWLEREPDPDRRTTLATQISRQWLAALGRAIDPLYCVGESSHFLVLGAQVYAPNDALLRTAEQCRARMLSLLPGIAEFHSPGKLVLLVLYGTDAYYDHVAYYHGEGEFGMSIGMHIRSDWPHVVLLETEPVSMHRTMAHELTHAALAGRGMPVWIEEGLAQMAEHDVSGEGVSFDFRRVRKQKEFWRSHGLAPFWSGASFSRSDESQEYSYQLAEILVRLLLEDFRPRWFGWDQQPRKQLLDFFTEAQAHDAGRAAAEKHLQLTLAQIAAKSLGEGNWAPGIDRDNTRPGAACE